MQRNQSTWIIQILWDLDPACKINQSHHACKQIEHHFILSNKKRHQICNLIENVFGQHGQPFSEHGSMPLGLEDLTSWPSSIPWSGPAWTSEAPLSSTQHVWAQHHLASLSPCHQRVWQIHPSKPCSWQCRDQTSLQHNCINSHEHESLCNFNSPKINRQSHGSGPLLAN